MPIFKISVWRGPRFKTSDPVVVKRYEARAERATYFPISVTRVHKNLG